MRFWYQVTEVTPIPSFPCISRGNLFNPSDCSVNASLAGGLWTYNIRGYLWGSNLPFLGLQINAGLLRVKLFQSTESLLKCFGPKFLYPNFTYQYNIFTLKLSVKSLTIVESLVISIHGIGDVFWSLFQQLSGFCIHFKWLRKFSPFYSSLHLIFSFSLSLMLSPQFTIWG